jgi:hypothetical protein
MSEMAVSLPPPRYWEDFELLMVEVFRRVWDDDDTQLHGRSGQRQNGVDIFGHDRKRRHMGAQCKRRSLFNRDGTPAIEDALSKETVKKDVEAADNFTPQLEAFVLATTLPRDTHLQKIARELTEERQNDGKFGVTIWSWTDTLDVLNRNGELLRWYFAHLVHPAARIDLDRVTLGVIQSAFSRPAFTTRMHVENGGDDFLQALIGTQQALNTGLLMTRDGTVVERAPPIKRLTNPDWVKRLKRVGNLIQQARDEYTRAVASGQIRDEGFLAVDHAVADRLNDLRAKALRALNTVLEEAGMDSVDSPLLS